MVAAQQYSGPIPPAEQLIKYNDAVPNAAERILSMAEKQSEHRRNLETKALNGNSNRASAGLGFAFVLSAATLASSVYVILQGHDVAGGALFSGTLVSLVGSFVYGSNQQRKERENRQH